MRMKMASIQQPLSPEALPSPFVISTGAYPDFLPRSPWTRPRVRLSLRKGAYCSPAQPTSTGNPGERSGEISVWMPLLGNVFRWSETDLSRPAPARRGGICLFSGQSFDFDPAEPYLSKFYFDGDFSA